jgi:acetyl-CoA acetyltransferase
MINVENACASGSTAFYLAHRAVASGQAELALAVGVEKLFCDDTGRSLKALATSADMEIEGHMGILFAGIYAMRVRAHMERYGLTREQLAKVAVKNHDHGALNPHAQYRNRVTLEEVLDSRMIADPITLQMTCPLGDGGAALLIGTEEMAKRMGRGREDRFHGPAASICQADEPDVTVRVSQRLTKSRVAPDITGRGSRCRGSCQLFLYEELDLQPGESGRDR